MVYCDKKPLGSRNSAFSKLSLCAIKKENDVLDYNIFGLPVILISSFLKPINFKIYFQKKTSYHLSVI